MDSFNIEGSEVRWFLVKRFGKGGAHVVLPKEALGRKVKIVFVEPLLVEESHIVQESDAAVRELIIRS